MSRSGIKSIAVNAAYLTTARLLTSAARAVYAIALAKVLGAELYGLFNYGLSWYLVFLPISVFGLNALLIREIGRDREQAGTLVGQTLTLRSISSFTVAVASGALAWFVETEPTLRLLIAIFSVALFGRGLALWVQTIFKAHEASGFVLAQEAVFRLLEVVIGIGLLLGGVGVLGLAALHAAIWVVQGLSGLALIRRYLVDVRAIWDPIVVKSLLRRGAPFVVGSFLTGWLAQGPILMYRHSEGVGVGLGELALALQAFFILGAALNEFGNAALPVLARSVARGDGKTDYFIRTALRAGLLMGGAAAIAGMALGPWLIDGLFGPGYALTASLLPWTLLLIGPYFMMTSLTSMVVAHGRYDVIVGYSAGGAAAFTLCFPLLVGAFGLKGVVMAIGIGQVVVIAGQILILRRYHSVRFLGIIARALLAVTGAMFVSWVCAVTNQWGMLLAGLLSLSILTIILGVIHPDELRKVVKALSLPARNGQR